MRVYAYKITLKVGKEYNNVNGFKNAAGLLANMAEKLETVISRGDQNTRPRDYYDIYILAKLQYANIELDALKAALNATTEKRGSETVIKEYRSIMDMVKNSEVMRKQWKNYQKEYEYATDIAFEYVCDVVVELMDEINVTKVSEEF